MLVILSSRERIDLITEDYYPRGLTYEQQIEKMRNTNSLSRKVLIELRDSLVLRFPSITDYPDSIQGEIWIYSAADKYADRKLEIHLNGSFSQSVDIRGLSLAKYEIIIDWKASGKEYLQKELFYP